MFKPCDKCNNGWIFDDRLGVASKCDCLKNYQNVQRFLLNQSKANIFEHDESVEDLVLKDKNLLSKVKYYAQNLENKTSSNCSLYLYGKNNCSKTFTAKSILYEACKKDIDCRFIIMGDLVDMITDAFATEKKNDKIDEYLNCELLVIDDAFDKAKVTLFKSGYQLPYLDRFIRKRLETYKLNTIFTSNVKIEEIQDNGFSYDIQNLIERNIKLRGGYLEFNDVFVSDEYNIDVKSIWD